MSSFCCWFLFLWRVSHESRRHDQKRGLEAMNFVSMHGKCWKPLAQNTFSSIFWIQKWRERLNFLLLPLKRKSPCQKGDVVRLRHIYNMSQFLWLSLSSVESISHDVRQNKRINSDLKAYKNSWAQFEKGHPRGCRGLRNVIELCSMESE